VHSIELTGLVVQLRREATGESNLRAGLAVPLARACRTDWFALPRGGLQRRIVVDEGAGFARTESLMRLCNRRSGRDADPIRKRSGIADMDRNAAQERILSLAVASALVFTARGALIMLVQLYLGELHAQPLIISLATSCEWLGILIGGSFWGILSDHRSRSRISARGRRIQMELPDTCVPPSPCSAIAWSPTPAEARGPARKWR